MFLAVVFPVHNGLSFTRNCLSSLMAEQLKERKNIKIFIVIVDDGSTDGTYNWVKNNYPEVNVLKGNGNLWWSGGINMAVKFAINQLHCDYILWWNNDILADSEYFSNLISNIESHNPKIIIGSKIYHASNKDVIWSMGGLFDPKTGKKSLIGTAMLDSTDYSKITICDWLPGMGTVTHKSVYENIGWLDDHNFPQYHGDSDFTFRAKKMGYEIKVYPDLKIYNDTRHSGLRHNESLRQLINSLFTLRSNYNIKKDLIFYKKHITSYRAYWVLFDKYFRYIGGFIKWKLFRIIGLKRTHL